MKGVHMNFYGFGDEYIVKYGEIINKQKHSHYSIQVIIPTKKLVYNEISTDSIILINSNFEHYISNTENELSILINPESEYGRKIKNKYFSEVNSSIVTNKSIHDKAKYFKRQIENAKNSEYAILEILAELTSNVIIQNDLDYRVKEILKQIRKSDITNLSYENILKNITLSNSRLRHLFSDEMDISLMKYVTWYRLTVALKELILTNKTITEVAHDCGLSDSAHLTRLFRSNFGVTPKITKSKNYIVKLYNDLKKH